MDRQPDGARTIAARMGEIALFSVPTALAIFAAFFALAWVSLGTDGAALSDRVLAAYASRDLRPDAKGLFGDTGIGVHQYNDCLILYQAIDDRASRLERAISPLSPLPGDQSPCTDLWRLTTSGPDRPPNFYHRYLHAHTTLARLLVPELGVAGLRDFYKLMLSLTLLSGIGFAMLDLARRRRTTENAVWLIVFAIFSRFFGLESFGQSLGHAPADLAILGFLLIISRASAERPVSRRFALIAAAVFGGLTIEFEFLTGGLPLGLAVVIGTLPFALSADERPGLTIIDAAASFVVGAVTCLLGKIVLLIGVFGVSPLTDAAGQLMFRAGLGDATNGDRTVDGNAFFWRVYAGLDSLAPGMPWLVVGLLALALAAGAWGYLTLREDDDGMTRMRVAALAGSNVVLLIWMVVFWEHTYAHAWFMDRILVWILVSGGALFYLALSRKRNQTFEPPTTAKDR